MSCSTVAEDALYRSVQHNYHDLLRALGKPVEHDSESPDDENGMNGAALVRRQNRINRLQRHGVVLPKQYKDVNVVTKWMVDMGYETAVSDRPLSVGLLCLTKNRHSEHGTT